MILKKRSILRIHSQAPENLIDLNNLSLNLGDTPFISWCIQVTIDTITELLELNRNLIIIANKTKPGDMENIRAAIKQFFDLPVFEIKQSKSLPNIFKEKKSVRAMVSDGGLKKYHFSVVADQFDLIIEYMKERGS